jgi:hypothetical protein
MRKSIHETLHNTELQNLHQSYQEIEETNELENKKN